MGCPFLLSLEVYGFYSGFSDLCYVCLLFDMTPKGLHVEDLVSSDIQRQRFDK